MVWMTGSVEYFGVDNLCPYFDTLSSTRLSPGRSGVPGLSIGSGEDSRGVRFLHIPSGDDFLLSRTLRPILQTLHVT
jgi:hypothetical protein